MFLALLSGVFLGGVFVFWLFRRGLTAHEWAYFRTFLDALRTGDYDELEGSEEHEEN